jgi:hypothetical protein
MPDATAWLLDTNILLRMSKIDDPQYPMINGALRTLVAQGAHDVHLADARRVLECVDTPARRERRAALGAVSSGR